MHSSNHFQPKIENSTLPRDEFIRLLELFVNENWENHETYSNFIRGFGKNFDDFSSQQSVRLIQSLVNAGLNQEDILEAVIKKVIADDNSRTRIDFKRQMIVNLIATSVKSDATTSKAFESLVSSETLDKLL